MKKFYCNVCDEEVLLQNGKCPKCKTDWSKIISDSKMINDLNSTNSINYKDYYEKGKEEYVEYKKITDDDIRSNIDFFLSWAGIVKVLIIIMSLIITIISIVFSSQTDGLSLLLLWIPVGLLIFAIIFENLLKWKAYMLYTNFKNKK